MAIGEKSRDGRPIGRLRRSADFQGLRRGRRIKAEFGQLQGIARTLGAEAGAGLRFGLIVPKRLGDAPRRNRIKRRLREGLRRAQRLGLFERKSVGGPCAEIGLDIGVSPSQRAADLDFDALVEQLASSVDTLMRGFRRLPI
jgi:ribonuclease P protein component